MLCEMKKPKRFGQLEIDFGQENYGKPKQKINKFVGKNPMGKKKHFIHFLLMVKAFFMFCRINHNFTEEAEITIL